MVRRAGRKERPKPTTGGLGFDTLSSQTRKLASG